MKIHKYLSHLMELNHEMNVLKGTFDHVDARRQINIEFANFS